VLAGADGAPAASTPAKKGKPPKEFRTRTRTLNTGPHVIHDERRRLLDGLVRNMQRIWERVYDALGYQARLAHAAGEKPIVIDRNVVTAVYSTVCVGETNSAYVQPRGHHLQTANTAGLRSAFKTAVDALNADREPCSKVGLGHALESNRKEVVTACAMQPSRVAKKLVKAIVRAAIERAGAARPGTAKERDALALAISTPLLNGITEAQPGCPEALKPHLDQMVLLDGIDYACEKTEQWPHERHTTQYFLGQVRPPDARARARRVAPMDWAATPERRGARAPDRPITWHRSCTRARSPWR
jgi:hypothetical protein